MRRLVCAFVVCKPTKTGFLASMPNYIMQGRETLYRHHTVQLNTYREVRYALKTFYLHCSGSVVESSIFEQDAPRSSLYGGILLSSKSRCLVLYWLPPNKCHDTWKTQQENKRPGCSESSLILTCHVIAHFICMTWTLIKSSKPKLRQKWFSFINVSSSYPHKKPSNRQKPVTRVRPVKYNAINIKWGIKFIALVIL